MYILVLHWQPGVVVVVGHVVVVLHGTQMVVVVPQLPQPSAKAPTERARVDKTNKKVAASKNFTDFTG